MFAVIFKAKIKSTDDQYADYASRLRKLAIGKYGCLEFNAVSEGGQEIAISYWENESQIKAWKKDPEHLKAQKIGQEKWYESYSVEVVEISRAYSWNENNNE